MNDIIIEFEKLLKNYVDNPEIVKVSENEYHIRDRIRDLKFRYIINTDKLTYRVQCTHIDEFTFIDSYSLGMMISNFKILYEISEALEVILKSINKEK